MQIEEIEVVEPFKGEGYTKCFLGKNLEGEPIAVELHFPGYPLTVLHYKRYLACIEQKKLLTMAEYDHYLGTQQSSDAGTPMKMVLPGTGASSTVIVNLPPGIIETGIQEEGPGNLTAYKYLTLKEWQNILELVKNERGWSEEELMDAIKEDGWMNKQRQEEAEIDKELQEQREKKNAL